jgi:hypothetical protein
MLLAVMVATITATPTVRTTITVVPDTLSILPRAARRLSPTGSNTSKRQRHIDPFLRSLKGMITPHRFLPRYQLMQVF